MPRLPERLPTPLSERLASAASALYSRMGREVDVAVGGIPFLLATSPDLPQSIETIEVRKEQFDAEVDPGEQSLSGYWRRSQASFHHGAGYLYEPNQTEGDFSGFYDSNGIDVFTPGHLTLLPKMVKYAPPVAMSTVFGRAGNDAVLISTAGDAYESDDPSVSPPVLRWTCPSGDFSGYAKTETKDYFASSTGRLWKTNILVPDAAAYWQLSGTGYLSGPKLMWAKHRLWACAGPNIWQPNVSGTPDTGATPVAPLFVNPMEGWAYTSMAEGPAAVYFGGHAGYNTNSTIQSITLDPTGALPTLSGATTAAVLPVGELIKHLAMVAGQYIGIGTSLGFRVGRIESNGQITYGPLLIKRADDDLPLNTYECSALATIGDSFLVAIRDANAPARIYKVNTNFEIEPLVFPYASDVGQTGLADGTYFTSLSVEYNTNLASSVRVLAVLNNGDYFEQDRVGNKVESGWLQSSRVRFHTTEPKSYKFLNVETEPLNGTISADLILEGGSTLPVGSITQQGEVYPDSFGIEVSPMRYLSVLLTLNRSITDVTVGPVVNSFLLRALPAIKPQRLITLPLLCFDREAGKSGQRYGAEGYASDRLRAIQLLEDTTETVAYQSFAEPNAPGLLVTIDKVRFVQTAPSDPTGRQGAGGVLILTLKTLEA